MSELLRLPRVAYHLAEASNWPSIQRHGLLSAAQLIRAHQDPQRIPPIAPKQHRPEHCAISETVALRDQKPMPPEALRRCLNGMEPAQWYALINDHVFFWFDPDRLNRQRKACGSRPQVVMTFKTTDLIAAASGEVFVTPINSGNARRRPAPRGRATLVPLPVWQKTGWAHEAEALGRPPRTKRHAPVELLLKDALPGAEALAINSREVRADEALSL